MRATNEVDVQLLAHLGDDVRAEGEASTARVDVPTAIPHVRVRPKQVEGHGRVRRVFRRTVEGSQLVETFQHGRQSTMHAKNTATNKSADWHPGHWLLKWDRRYRIEKTNLKGAVESVTVATAAFSGEPIVEIDRLSLVVTAKKEEILRVFDFEGEKQRDRLDTLRSAVHIVAKEQVIDLRWEAMVTEHTQQVRVLKRWLEVHVWKCFGRFFLNIF